MKTKTLVATVVVLLVAALGWHFNPWSSRTFATADIAGDSGSGVRKDERATEQRGTRLPGGTFRVKTDRPLMAPLSAATANEIAVGGARKYEGPGEEAYVRGQLAELCTNVPSPERQRTNASAKALAALQTPFCAGYNGRPEDERARLLSLPADDPYVTSYGLASEAFDLATEAKSPQERNEVLGVLESIATDPSSGFEALVAAEALHQLGFVSPALAGIARTSGWSLSHQDLAEAQLLATRMRMCDRYGGCDAGQLQSMAACSSYGVCDHAASADGTWQRVFSPQVYSAARRLNAGG
ncbi:hypothetical protein SAMN05428982_0628 [Pseudoxanthomonas sp. CF385]|nr:hypothetical protein SAMN05428982_0628 [Pseudoxanthomonas sp. CF385]